MQELETLELSPVLEPSQLVFTMDTIGWQIVFIFLLLSLCFGLYKYFRYYTSNAYRRYAISETTKIPTYNLKSIDALIVQVMFQLKQTALQTYNRKTVASLEGQEWLNFLDEKGKTKTFSSYHDVISDAIYKNKFSNETDFNQDDFITVSINWIKNHA